MKNKDNRFKCWICKDSGMVFFNKYKNGIEYELAYRCSCLKGQASSKKIMTVPQVLAENIAIENYKRIREIDIEDLSIIKEIKANQEQSTLDLNISLFEKTRVW